jgi:hypothetical protein
MSKQSPRKSYINVKHRRVNLQKRNIKNRSPSMADSLSSLEGELRQPNRLYERIKLGFEDFYA